MVNIIEDARRRASQKQINEQTIQDTDSEVRTSNHSLFLKAKQAFEASGILLVLQEPGNSLMNGYTLGGNYLDYKAVYEDFALLARLGKDKLEHMDLHLGRVNSVVENNKIKQKSQYVDIQYYSNGALRFVSAAANPEVPTRMSYQDLMQNQWSTDTDLVASTLEAALKNPYQDTWEPVAPNNDWRPFDNITSNG